MSDSPSPDDQAFVASGAPNPAPAGEAFEVDPEAWYNLRVMFVTKEGATVAGYASYVSRDFRMPFWDYMSLWPESVAEDISMFKLHPRSDGWAHWEIDDGNYLSLKATGWVYRSSAYPLGWRISDGRLYNDYWNGPVGYRYESGGGFAAEAYYMGMRLPEFTCELVPA